MCSVIWSNIPVWTFDALGATSVLSNFLASIHCLANWTYFQVNQVQILLSDFTANCLRPIGCNMHHCEIHLSSFLQDLVTFFTELIDKKFQLQNSLKIYLPLFLTSEFALLTFVIRLWLCWFITIPDSRKKESAVLTYVRREDWLGLNFNVIKKQGRLYPN